MLASISTIPYPGRLRVGPIAVEEAEPLLAGLMVIGTQKSRNLQLNQLLQAMAGKFGDQLPGRPPIE